MTSEGLSPRSSPFAGVTLGIVVWSSLRGSLLLWAAAKPPIARTATEPGSWLVGSAGLVSLGWGISLKLYAEPDPSALMAWFGVYLVLFGVTMLAFALRVRINDANKLDKLNPFADGVTLRCIGHVLFRATEFVATGALAAVIVALLYVLVVSMERQTIDIRTMSVPKEWEDQGYTSSVAAARLKDTINQIVADADSAMVPPRFGSEGPEVEIHEVWFHPDAIAGWLGTWLGLRRQQDVSGEITIEGCRAQLRIRYNGTLLSDHPSVDFDCGDKEIRDGGQTRETSEVKRNKGANSEAAKANQC